MTYFDFFMVSMNLLKYVKFLLHCYFIIMFVLNFDFVTELLHISKVLRTNEEMNANKIK